MVDGMSVVVNVMSLMSPRPALCNMSVLNIFSVGGEVMYFWSVCLGGELGFLNCDDICICVVNKQLWLDFGFDSVYVDLHYHEISLIFTAGSVCLCGVCSSVFVFGLSVRLSWYPM